MSGKGDEKRSVTISGSGIVANVSTGEKHSGTMTTNIGYSPAQVPTSEQRSVLQRSVPQVHFDGENTWVLMVTGKPEAGDKDEFENDAKEMKNMMVTSFGFREDRILLSSSMNTETPDIDTNLLKIKQNLRKMNDGFFIFFYAGHFGCHRFHIRDERYLDENLKKELALLPAAKMLLILDTCYAGQAGLGARGPDDSELPCLWDMFHSGARGPTDDKQVLQWCANLDTPACSGLEGINHGLFTHTILTVMRKLPSEKPTTVLDIHKEVLPLVQEAVLKPDRATENPDVYFATFPAFFKHN